MRRLLIALAVVGLTATAATNAFAQQQQQRQQQQSDEDRDAQRQRQKLDREMQNQDLPLPELANSGPCPYVKVLYDASRKIDFVGDRKASSAVAFSSEIQGLSSTCAYKGSEPIVVDINVTFAIGKGPQATGNTKGYSYWVAVTDRNLSVLAKERFTISAVFPAGSDRVLVFERIQNITIPRVNDRVSGENFEVLVGFDVDAEQADFNRQGTRFTVNATGQQAAAGSPAPAGTPAPQ